MESSTIQITPFFMEIDGVTVEVLEASKTEFVWGETTYTVSVKIIYKGIHSKVFPLFVKNLNDLINKLKVEITKVKVLEYTYGLDEVKRVIT